MKIVRVRWVDSCGYSAWRSLADMIEQAAPDSCETVGYLIKSGKKALTVAQSLGATGNVDNTITIPRSAIRGTVETLGNTSMPKKGAW